MRTITTSQKRALEDLAAQGLLRGLPIQTAEKDIHITELLKALSGLEVHHENFKGIDKRKGESTRHDSGIKFVFAGGTCLSKAHGLINRMSEDVDIKVVLSDPEHPLKTGIGDRARLKSLHAELPKLLEKLEFPLLEYAEGSNPRIRDSHRYYVVGAGYKSVFEDFGSLRPELKLELIHRHPMLNTERRQFGYLYEQLAGLPLSQPLEIDCISVAETAAEKVVSLLRRCAYKWDGHQTKGDIDPALVRHVYDVARIAQLRPEALATGKSIFANLVVKDRDEFKGQNPEFDADAPAVLRKTLEAAKSNGLLQAQYERHLTPLVYDQDRLSFAQAFEVFEVVAADFIEACET